MPSRRGSPASSKILNVCLVAPALAGHLDPMAALGSALADRGHAVTLLHPASGFAPRAVDRRIAVRTVGTSVALPSSGVVGVVRALAETTEKMLDALPGALERLGPDVVVVDQVMAAGGLACRLVGVPFVSVANALPIDQEPVVPPYFTSWRFDASFVGRWRNRGGWRIHDAMMRPVDANITRRARAWGLSARRMRDCLSDEPGIAQTVDGFDYPRGTGPMRLGPFRVGNSPARAARGQATAFVSLGTLQGHREELLSRIAAACRHAGLFPIIAHGGRLPADAVAGLTAEGADVRDFLDQRAVLAGASLCVCHGGLNTVLDALAAGVPLVVVPLAFEQAAIAARVAWSGAGRRVGPARVDTLRRAVRNVAEQPAYAAAARAIAATIAGAGGARQAAAIIEARAGVPRAADAVPPAAPTMARAAAGGARGGS